MDTKDRIVAILMGADLHFEEVEDDQLLVPCKDFQVVLRGDEDVVVAYAVAMGFSAPGELLLEEANAANAAVMAPQVTVDSDGDLLYGEVRYPAAFPTPVLAFLLNAFMRSADSHARRVRLATEVRAGIAEL